MEQMKVEFDPQQNVVVISGDDPLMKEFRESVQKDIKDTAKATKYVAEVLELLSPEGCKQDKIRNDAFLEAIEQGGYNE